MANIKSQKKRIITNEKSRMRNRAVKSELKTASIWQTRKCCPILPPSGPIRY